MRKLPCFILFVIMFSGVLLTSQTSVLSYEKVAEDVERACIMKVDRVESEERYQHFRNGVKQKISSTIIVYGTVQKTIAGRFDSKILTTRHTLFVPVDYDEEGNVTMRYSPRLPVSGLEHRVEIGKRYIFSYKKQPDKNSELVHLRMDLPEEEQHIRQILKTRHSKPADPPDR